MARIVVLSVFVAILFVATRSNGQDPQLSQRDKWFRWVSQTEGLKHVGWRRQSIKTEPTADGWLVEVRISPEISKTEGGVAFTPDAWIETRKVEGGKLTFVKASAAPGAKHFIFVD